MEELSPLKKRPLVIVLLHALIGWIGCAATIGIGMSLTTRENALLIHAVLAPVLFSLISLNYHKKYHHYSPLHTAGIFLLFVVAVDFGLVALVINRSLEMFSSLLGTWIPFVLIFLSSYGAGSLVRKGTQPE